MKASSTSSTFAELKINTIPTKPVEGQKTGTSGLGKKLRFSSRRIIWRTGFRPSSTL